jgi:RAVE protein 1 C terminal
MPFLSVCLSFFKIVIILIRAYHSESEEELLIMIPSVSKGTPAWPELRELGVAWWVKNDNTLRHQCYKKTFVPSFQFCIIGLFILTVASLTTLVLSSLYSLGACLLGKPMKDVPRY